VTQLGTALFVLLTFLSTSATAVIINQTVAGFFLCSFFSAFWAFPMKTIPRTAMGTAAGFINMAGQLAGFIAPILVGYVFGKSGSFDAVFGLLIASLLGSTAFALTFSKQLPRGAVAV
jgi:nitrate/nitrite transporter NarK